MKGEAWRWAVCAAIVVAAHGLAWRALSMPDLAADSDAGSPVVTLELSPIAAAPAPPPDEAPADAAPAEAPAAVSAQPQPVAPPAEKPPDPPPDPPPPAHQPTPDALAPPAPPHDETPKDAPAVVALPPQPARPPPAAPSIASTKTADLAAAPANAPGREEDTSPAVLSRWRRELIAQIERHKRFPPGALGRSGVVSVAFSIDRSGHLTAVRLAASSGSAALDQASLDLIRRAQPFPAPPENLGDGELSFVAPIRYLPSASR